MQKITFLSLLVWGLAIQLLSAQGGTSCSNASTAVQGINISDNSTGDQWFQFTATITGKVTVSTCGLTSANTYVEIYDGCDLEAFATSDNFCNEQSEVSFEVISGLTYYINWRNFYTNSQYEWSLQQSSAAQGEFCSNPLFVSAGNTVSNAPQNKYRWFKFTATRTGKVTVSAIGTEAESCRVAVFNDCMFTTSLNNDLSWNPSKIAFEGVEGETYLISWQNGATSGVINWTIEETNWQAGERCIDPIDIDISKDNPIDHANATNKWYRFIARQNDKITISSIGVTNEDTYLEVYNGCGQDPALSNDDTDGLQSEIVMDVVAGQAYLIKWDKIFTPDPYAWSLKSDQVATDLPDVEEDDLNVFPNPTDGFVNVDLTSFDSKTVQVRVLTLTGATVKSFELSGGMVTNFDISELTTGIYQIVFEDLVTQKVVRLLKQ